MNHDISSGNPPVILYLMNKHYIYQLLYGYSTVRSLQKKSFK